MNYDRTEPTAKYALWMYIGQVHVRLIGKIQSKNVIDEGNVYKFLVYKFICLFHGCVPKSGVSNEKQGYIVEMARRNRKFA